MEITLFPKAGKSGKKATMAVTNKSELLFVWLMLDLLRVGGRCAVIVPEGVLFGNQEAHKLLRRELMTEHLIEAVISLPGGVFQPYTGVKTSILVFQKETRKEDRDKWKPVDPPRTQSVWFYEIIDEAFSLDAKRTERRGQNSDIWDALEKFKTRLDAADDSLAYYQPTYHTERWRMVDSATMNVFSDEPEVSISKGKAVAISELFKALPADPVEAVAAIEKKEIPALQKLAFAILNEEARTVAKQIKPLKKDKQKDNEVQNAFKKAATAFRSLCTKQKQLFDNEEQVAWKLFQKAFKDVLEQTIADLKQAVLSGQTIKDISVQPDKSEKEAERIAKEYARLDGYDVMLRSLEVFKSKEPLSEARSWTAPVRVYTVNEDWKSEDGIIKGSHDKKGNVRPEYVANIELYDQKGKLNEDLLDPDCIEARDWNLSAGQYKPFNFEAMKSDKSVAEMIRELKDQELKIVEGLDRLMFMVEGGK